jgi:hypothetical protein
VHSRGHVAERRSFAEVMEISHRSLRMGVIGR